MLISLFLAMRGKVSDTMFVEYVVPECLVSFEIPSLLISLFLAMFGKPLTTKFVDVVVPGSVW